MQQNAHNCQHILDPSQFLADAGHKLPTRYVELRRRLLAYRNRQDQAIPRLADRLCDTGTPVDDDLGALAAMALAETATSMGYGQVDRVIYARLSGAMLAELEGGGAQLYKSAASAFDKVAFKVTKAFETISPKLTEADIANSRPSEVEHLAWATGRSAAGQLDYLLDVLVVAARYADPGTCLTRDFADDPSSGTAWARSADPRAVINLGARIPAKVDARAWAIWTGSKGSARWADLWEAGAELKALPLADLPGLARYVIPEPVSKDGQAAMRDSILRGDFAPAVYG